MTDPTGDVALPTVESSLRNLVHALLREINTQSASQKVWLRWSLQKKLESDPSCSAVLLRELVKELEKMHKKIHETHSYMHVIPLLHTVHYLAIQSGTMIPKSLYQTVCEHLMKLLILPTPYSAVALSTLRSIKMEMITPGSLFQRRVIAEQNLKSEHFTQQEKVFVLADPAVFSVSLEATVRAYLDVSGFVSAAPTMQKIVMLRVLPTGLGITCHRSRLAQALKALEDDSVETFFQELVLAMEQSIKHGADGRANYLNKLHDIYRDILTAAEDEKTTADNGSVFDTALPFPEVNFHLWREEEDLWNLLANFVLRCCPNSSVDEGLKDKRDSVRSEDGVKERDLKQSDFDDEKQRPSRKPMTAIGRRNAWRNLKRVSLLEEKTEEFPGSPPVLKEGRRRHTARVVVMGDDRVLGRLSKAHYSIRERESKSIILSKKLDIQLYYIPVTDVEPPLSPTDSPCQGEDKLFVASLLGRVDPWYNCNINSLRAAIFKLDEMNADHSKPSQKDLFLLDAMCYYLRCETQPVNLPLYSVKMTRSGPGDLSSVVDEVFVSHLEADIPEFRHIKEKITKDPSSRKKKSSVGVFGRVISVSYTKNSLSKREVVKGEAPMTYGVVITSELATVTGGDYLAVTFESVNPEYNTKIQTKYINLRTMEQRTLSVCLDRDSRRTYTDIQKIEISPCLDPGCNIRSRSSFSSVSERELPLSKYLNNVLSLPINTFSGVTL